jgi:hypothetical protein
MSTLIFSILLVLIPSFLTDHFPDRAKDILNISILLAFISGMVNMHLIQEDIKSKKGVP